MATSSTPSSSAKKVARLAQRGKGKKVRFQGGLLFPGAIIITILIGLVTVVYARESRPDPGSGPPQVGDHWHAAYGFYVCDTWLPVFTDAKEEQTIDPQTGGQQLVDDEYALTGVHTHGDGVVHFHPFSTRAVGKRAKLKVFLDVYDVELSNDSLTIPGSEGGGSWNTDDGFPATGIGSSCEGEDMEIKVISWDSYTDTGNGQTYITDIDDVPLRNDGMVFAVAVVPRGKVVSMPEWAARLPELGAADGGNVPTTTPDGQPVTSDGTVDTSTGDTGATDTTTVSDGTATDGSTVDTTGATTPGTGTTADTSAPSTDDPGATDTTG